MSNNSNTFRSKSENDVAGKLLLELTEAYTRGYSCSVETVLDNLAVTLNSLIIKFKESEPDFDPYVIVKIYRKNKKSVKPPNHVLEENQIKLDQKIEVEQITILRKENTHIVEHKEKRKKKAIFTKSTKAKKLDNHVECQDMDDMTDEEFEVVLREFKILNDLENKDHKIDVIVSCFNAGDIDELKKLMKNRIEQLRTTRGLIMEELYQIMKTSKDQFDNYERLNNVLESIITELTKHVAKIANEKSLMTSIFRFKEMMKRAEENHITVVQSAYNAVKKMEMDEFEFEEEDDPITPRKRFDLSQDDLKEMEDFNAILLFD